MQPSDSPPNLPPDARGSEAASGEQYAGTPDMEAELPEAGAVPPGYDWPTHGGYLGCLLGMLPACLVAGFLSSTFVAWPWFNGKSNLHPVLASAVIVALFVVCVYGFGRIGWVLGRRFYRKYPRPGPTWGEDDGAHEKAHTVDGVDETDVSDADDAGVANSEVEAPDDRVPDQAMRHTTQ